MERKTGLVLLSKVKDKTAETTTRTISQRLSAMPRHTITFDNGFENQNWLEIERLTGARCFFTHPYQAWERGTNENTNGLVRWYFPKGTDFRNIPDEDIETVEYALNTRPRKRLNWKTPLEVFLETFTKTVALGG